jgi:hypothetical protein
MSGVTRTSSSPVIPVRRVGFMVGSAGPRRPVLPSRCFRARAASGL